MYDQWHFTQGIDILGEMFESLKYLSNFWTTYKAHEKWLKQKKNIKPLFSPSQKMLDYAAAFSNICNTTCSVHFCFLF